MSYPKYQEEVELFIESYNAPYVLTKPIHHSQKLLERTKNGIVIQLKVQLNLELERENLGFGDCIRVLKPNKLKRRIQEKVKNAAELYEKELKISELEHSMKKLKRNGYAILENMYTSKEKGKMLSMTNRATEDADRFPRGEEVFALRCLLREIPKLSEVLFKRQISFSYPLKVTGLLALVFF